MYFAVNLAFLNYYDNLIGSLDVPIFKNWTSQEQIFPYYWKYLKLTYTYQMSQK